MPGAWAGSDRRSRLPKDWKKRRLRVLLRDGFRCTWRERGERCTRRATDVDHIDPGDDHRESNLTSLCGPHHRVKSALEGVMARPKRRSPPEPHPGIVHREA